MKKTIILFILFFSLFIGVVDKKGEFDHHYMFFLKKPWSFKLVYHDPIGERDFRDVPKEQLKNYLSYCNANIFNQFPCTLDMQREAKEALIEQ